MTRPPNLLARRPEGTLEAVFRSLTRLDARAPESLALRGTDDSRAREKTSSPPGKRKSH